MSKQDDAKKRFSRREFIKSTGLVLGGLAAGATGASVFTVQYADQARVPRAEGHIALLPLSESACSGCGTCEIVCAAWHDSASGPNLRRIWLERSEIELNFDVLTCLQCDYPACYFACPRRDRALCIDETTGIRYIEHSECRPDCQKCIQACPAEPPRINWDPEKNTALMCDLCRGRAEGPVCIEFCPAECLEKVESAAGNRSSDGRAKFCV